MSQVERLLAEYMEERQSGGEADPVAYLERAAPKDRQELAALIDGYLARAPRQPFDETSFRDSRAEATVEALERSIGGAAGLWPALLPRLRARAGLRRRELVERLAVALGVGEQRAKVERYYHEMELGLLPAGGVSSRVLEVLAKLIGSTATELRDAGADLSTGGGAQTAATEAFARTVQLDAIAAAPPKDAAPAEEPWDEVDELFRGSG
jgi:hypothetical protein